MEDRLKGAVPVLDIRLFEISGTPITVATLILFVLLIVGTFALSWTLQRAAKRAMRIRRVTDEGTVGVVQRLLHYAIIATGILIGLQTVGVKLSALFAAGAVFAIGLGFAMQNIMQNFVAGLILLMERAIKPGDVLQVEGQFVKVRDMSIRTTTVRTLDEEEIIMPNSNLVQSAVTNYTFRDSYYRVRCNVGVIYSSDLGLVRKTLETVARELPWRSSFREPVIQLVGFGSSSVDYEVSVWVEDPWRVRHYKSAVHEAIWTAFQDTGITIAFPQLDVHLDPPVVQSLEGLRRTG
jgi:small-conductance mechanosensitive channel